MAKTKEFRCPHCGKAISASQYAKFLGSKGGLAGTPESKRRTREQAQAAVRARWAKVKGESK